MVPVSAVPTDEIYERYLKKAISEINELGDEIRRAGGEKHVPVLGSGHPLADVFLLSLRTAQVLRRPKSLVYLQGLKWVAQAKERVF